MAARKAATPKAVPAIASKTELLLSAVGQAVEQVRTKTLDLSFNELMDMYNQKELIIHPDFQRLFRWPTEKRSQFIESLLVELPIPPIYVVEEQDGTYELIDGLQRFSSYLQFRGALEKDGKLVPALTLQGCDVVPELNGSTYEDLPTALQIRLKRISVPTQVLRRESDRRLRYHMFKRLNTGGEPLSDQEVRNATIRLLSTPFNEFIQRMAKVSNYVACVDLMTDEAKNRMYREECVLRFFAFKNDFGRYEKLIAPFLDQFMEEMSDPEQPATFDYESEASIFEETFRILSTSVGAQAFSTITKAGGLGNQFSTAHFDMLTQGVQKHLPTLSELSGKQLSQFGQQILLLKKDPSFRSQTTGGGKNYPSAYRRTFKFVEDWVGKWLRTA